MECYRRVQTLFPHILQKLTPNSIPSFLLCCMGALKKYEQNLPKRPFIDGKAVSIVMHVFRCRSIFRVSCCDR